MSQLGEKPKTAIVIGAGAGGVALAARLGKAGFAVTVIEKNSFTGGRCSLMFQDGHRFDQGPSLFLLPQLFHETFRDLDTTLADAGVDLLRCETNYNIWFHDGELFKHSSDLAAMKTQIERWEGKDGFERYLKWLREAHTHYEISVKDVLHRNFGKFLDLARPGFVRHVVNLHPLESIWSRASRYFWTERLRRVFTFAVMYMGMSPFDAPATYSLLQYTEFAEGIWYPKGGFHQVVAALVRIGEKMGVKYRLNTPVSRVLTDGHKATGVELESGESLSADVVVVNADLTPTITDYTKSLRKREASCSSISFYWCMDRKIPELSVHNIFLAEEYRESFDAIFKRHSLPDQPSFYDRPLGGPEGKDTVIVLVPVGHLAESKGESGLTNDPKHWDDIVARARAAVIEIVSARTGCAPLSDFITHETVNTPLTWEDKFNLDKGAILGLTHGIFNVLAFRRGPAPRAWRTPTSTHPGTGVPIVMAGAKITAEQILDDRGLQVPWARGFDGILKPQSQSPGNRKLDNVRYGYHFGSEEVAILSVGLVLALIYFYFWPTLQPLLC
ncbi:phytoene dehydrogenase [Colletotrichum tofieldiae]|nr:phytoene dehydrogenase [Colletotrichum tofieldiae]